MPSKSEEDIGEECITLEPKKTNRTKRIHTSTLMSVSNSEVAGDLQSWLRDRYNPDGGNHVHCKVTDCCGICSLTKKKFYNSPSFS